MVPARVDYILGEIRLQEKGRWVEEHRSDEVELARKKAKTYNYTIDCYFIGGTGGLLRKVRDVSMLRRVLEIEGSNAS